MVTYCSDILRFDNILYFTTHIGSMYANKINKKNKIM